MIFSITSLITSAFVRSNVAGCVTPALLKNIKEKLNGPDDIDGYEDLTADDQKKVEKAWETGHGEWRTYDSGA